MPRVSKAEAERAFKESQSIQNEIPETIEASPGESTETNEFAEDAIDNEMRVVEDLKAALSGTEVPRDAQVRLYRRKEGEKLVYLHSWPAAEFSQDQIQTKFGGGRYQIKAYAINPRTGRVGIFINREFECEDPIGGLKTASAASPVQDALAAKLDKLIELQSQPRQQTAEPIELALSLMDRFVKMQPAPAPQPPQTSIKEMIETMMLMRDFAGEMAPGRPKEPSELETLANVAGGLMQAINSAPQPQPQLPSGPAPAYPPLNQNISTGIGMEQPESNDVIAATFTMRLAANAMLGAAKANEPIKPFAEKAIALVNTDLLLNFVDAPDWFERVLQLSPEAVNFRPWYENLRQEILTQFPPEPDSVPASAAS